MVAYVHGRRMDIDLLKGVLPEKGETFPTKVTALAGKTLVHTGSWWKAIVLVQTEYGEKKIQLRLYGWQRNKNKEWKKRQQFNISASPYSWQIIRSLETFLTGSVKDISSIKTINNLMHQIERLKAERKVQYIEKQADRLEDLEAKLKEFEELLDKKEKESKYQTFLKDNFWMFGPDYCEIFKEAKAGMSGRNDYVLQRNDGYHDVLELKKPSSKLFTSDKFPSMYTDLKNALSQMSRYLAYFSKHYLSHKEETGKDIYSPQGIIVIGRRREEEREILKEHKNILSRQVEILTYDDILDKAKRTIDVYKNYKKEKK